jgi:hypothetical protein
MAESIAQRLNGTQLDSQTKRNLLALFEALRADQALLVAKLNADATVTDTNYGAANNLTA